jgi:hypothetical protein
MHPSPTTQIFTMFGCYVPEQHQSEKGWQSAKRDTNHAVASLTVSMFDEMLASLRSALSLR